MIKLLRSTILPLLRVSSPNSFIGDPWSQTYKSWIPDQNRFGNDIFCNEQRINANQIV